MNKKIALGFVVFASVFVAQSASAVAIAETKPADASTFTVTSMPVGEGSTNSVMMGRAGGQNIIMQPMGVRSEMGTKAMGNVMYFKGEHGNLGGWFALMFVLTVAMVWVVLLLTIGILWHKLKRMSHDHKHHHHEHN